MKLTTASYNVPTGTLTIARVSRSERLDPHLLVKLNGAELAEFSYEQIAHEVTMGTWHTIAYVFQMANGHRGTNSDVRSLTEELQRFF